VVGPLTLPKLVIWPPSQKGWTCLKKTIGRTGGIGDWLSLVVRVSLSASVSFTDQIQCPFNSY